MSRHSGVFPIVCKGWITWVVILSCLVGLQVLQAVAQGTGAPVEESLEQHVVEGDVVVTLAADRRSMGMADQLRVTCRSPRQLRER